MTVEVYGSDGATGGVPDEPPDATPESLAAAAEAFAEATRARRAAAYGRMAARSTVAGAVALGVATVVWVFGVQSTNPVFRILVVVGGLLWLVAILSGLLRVVATMAPVPPDGSPEVVEAEPDDEADVDDATVPDRLDGD